MPCSAWAICTGTYQLESNQREQTRTMSRRGKEKKVARAMSADRNEASRACPDAHSAPLAGKAEGEHTPCGVKIYLKVPWHCSSQPYATALIISPPTPTEGTQVSPPVRKLHEHNIACTPGPSRLASPSPSTHLRAWLTAHRTRGRPTPRYRRPRRHRHAREHVWTMGPYMAACGPASAPGSPPVVCIGIGSAPP